MRYGTLLSCTAAICSLAVASAHAASSRDAVRLWRKTHEKAIVADFVALLSMPNVATNVTDVEKNAAYIESQLKARGFQTRQSEGRARYATFSVRADEGPGCEAYGDFLRSL